MIKKPIIANHPFFTSITFSKINSFAYQFYCNTTFKTSNLQKDCYKDNLPFACLQLYKNDCLNIPTCNTCFHTQVKNQ